MPRVQIKNFIRVTWFTIVDLVKLKSIYILLCLFLLLIFVGIGMKSGNEHTTRTKYAWTLYFHIIATGSLLFTILLSMDAIKKDISTGKILMFLSRQTGRSLYITGRLTGTNVIIFFFMTFLHTALSIKIFVLTGTFPTYIIASSIICMLNNFLLSGFIILLSFFMPGFVAAMVGIFISGVSFFFDTIHLVMNSGLLKGLLASNGANQTHWMRVIWPKIYSLQYYAGNIFNENYGKTTELIHPIFNIVFYIAAVCLIMVVVFRRRDITFEV